MTQSNVQYDTPTVKSGQGWLICNSSLGCGSRVLQGWSSGIGIASSNKQEFEKKFFHLLYLSKNQDKCTTKWGYLYKDRQVEAPISVSMGRYQFLEEGTTYTFSSTSDWIERFVAFIQKYDLGTVSVGHKWINKHYMDKENQTGTWTWNGKLPKSADVGIENWGLPE
jgi:hypothetical protein